MTTSNENSAAPAERLTRKELMGIYWRALTINGSFQYERQMNQGFAYAMIPLIKKLYPKQEDRAAALMRHSEFFNITPALSTLPMGLAAAMEEESARSGDFDATSVNAVKASLMGPLSGIGDSLSWGTVRPLAGGIACSLALSGNAFAPLLFLLLFNVFNFGLRYVSLVKAYELGTSFLTKIEASGVMQKAFLAVSIVGLLVIGAMSASMVTVNLAFVIGEGDTAVLLNDVINGIMPKMLSLLVTLLLYWLVRRGHKVNTLLVGVILASIALSFLGIV